MIGSTTIAMGFCLFVDEEDWFAVALFVVFSDSVRTTAMSEGTGGVCLSLLAAVAFLSALSLAFVSRLRGFPSALEVFSELLRGLVC